MTTVVESKTTDGPNITAGSWIYEYAPSSYEVPLAAPIGTVTAGFLDTTTVTTPNAIHVYYHVGAWWTYSLTPLLLVSWQSWQIGLLQKEEIYDLSAAADSDLSNDTPFEVKTQEWVSRLISNEDFGQDLDTYVPMMSSVNTWRNGNTHSTFMSNYDAYGNPGTVEETTIIGGQPGKITNITYFNDAVNWIIDKTEDETLTDIGTIDRTYNALGQVISENKYGVLTTFTYTAEGDINTITDARNNVVTKQDYYRGIPRTELYPESVTIVRTVNDTGTVASLTNGRGFIKNFTYDSLNRLTGIDFPLNADVSVNWTSTGKMLIRGDYEETVTFYGYGKEVQVDRTDSNTMETITKTTNYDALGQKTWLL